MCMDILLDLKSSVMDIFDLTVYIFHYINVLQRERERECQIRPVWRRKCVSIDSLIQPILLKINRIPIGHRLEPNGFYNYNALL